MPIPLPSQHPVVLVRRQAFERVGLQRAAIDDRFNLTPDEFRVEGSLVAVGPLPSEDMTADLIAALEASGLTYYDDFVEMSGNWPEWLGVFAMARGESEG